MLLVIDVGNTNITPVSYTHLFEGKSRRADRHRIRTCIRYQDPAGYPVCGGADGS